MTLYLIGFIFTLAALANYLDLKETSFRWLWLLLLAVAWPLTLGIAASDVYHKIMDH